MTYDTVYKIVGMEDSSQKPIFFESGLTFETMREPSRVVSASIVRYENTDKEAIISVDGILLNDQSGYNITLSLDNRKTIIQASTQTSGGWETRVNLKGEDEDGTGLIYGKTYSLSKVIRLSNLSEVHCEEISLRLKNEPSRLVKVESGSTSDFDTLSLVLSTRQLSPDQPYCVTLTGTPKDGSTSNAAHEVVIEVNGAPTITKSVSLYPVQTVKYNHVYTVSSMNLSSSATSILINIDACSFSTPAAPTRIISATNCTDWNQIPQSKDFKIIVRELDALSQPTGSPIELSSSFTAEGSSTSHTMTTPIFGETSAKLQFEKSYVITDLLISGMSTVVDSDVTFKVPAEPSRLISIGPMTYSNQDREVSVSLSGVKLSGTYWIVLKSNTSTADVNVSVSFSETGSGELKGILYSQALPLSMNMTYDTVYKIVGMEDSSQKPIFFESGLTFETMKEPTRIEDGKCQLNPVRDNVIMTLTGRVLSPGDYSVVLTHSETSKSRTITGSVNNEGNVECSHSVDTNEEDSLVFGEMYSISSAHRDGSPIHVTSGLTLQIPRPPKVTEAIVHPNTLNTAVTIELLGTGLDLQGNYSVALVDGQSFTILFNAESKVTSPPLLIGLQDTLQFDTNYTLKSITNVKPEHDIVLLENPLTLHGSLQKNSTMQSNSLFIPSNGFLVLSKYQLAGPTLRIPSAASMGERKGMIEVKDATLQISDILILIQSVSDSFVFVFGDSSSVLLTGCSIVGSAQTSNSQQSPEDMCSWSGGSFRLVDCTTTIDTAKLTHLSQGAINMEGGHLSIEAGSFHDNTPIESVFPSFRRNIRCSNAGHITIESLYGGDGSGEKHPHFWISQNDCSLSGEDSKSDTPLFIPTLSSGSKSNQDKKSKVYSIEISGSVLIPCGLWLEIVEITKSKSDGNTAKLELTSGTCKSLTENLISLDLPPSLVKDLDSSLEWQGRLIFGNEVRSSTSFVIQKSSADKRSQAVRDNMKWWIPLVVILAVALLVFIVIVVILLRRRKQKKAAKSNEMTEINTMVEDIKFEEETVDQSDQLHKSSFATPTEAMRQDLVFVETGKIRTNLPSYHDKDDEDDKLEDFVIACGVDGNETRAVNKNDTLFNRLHHPTPGMSVDKMAVQKQLVAALSSISAKGTHNFILRQLSPHQVFFDSAGVVCLSCKQRPHNKTTIIQPAQTQSGQDNDHLVPSRVWSDNKKHTDQSTPKAEHEEDRWKAPETGEGKELDGGACAVFSLGLILWEMETLQIPFREVDAVNAQRQLGVGALPPMAGLDASLAAMITQCLSLDAKNRPTFEEIERFLDHPSLEKPSHAEETKQVKMVDGKS
ncbi:hypothetical protein BLNAU_18184 [Blattamonas nauphoetae]|uniref:Protein kinase domain-containing protein n=1 Tax=Blattamonas nauphoetae TaxID=2049346 RepID=A0ABQ9X9K8_9EUKA|nr:hypothetical protein BLNAU_18184 [Blattamonas nauphoetae]